MHSRWNDQKSKALSGIAGWFKSDDMIVPPSVTDFQMTSFKWLVKAMERMMLPVNSAFSYQCSPTLFIDQNLRRQVACVKDNYSKTKIERQKQQL